jgi:hypothetical protein
LQHQTAVEIELENLVLRFTRRIRHPTGHPPFVPTPSERSFVQTMAGARMSADEICKVIGSARGDGRPIAKTTLYRHFGNEMKNGQAMLKALIMGRYRAVLDEGAAWATQMGMRTLFRWDINSALLPPDPAGTTTSIRVKFVKPDPKLIEDDRPVVEHEQRHDEGPPPGQRLLPPPSQQPMPDLSKRNGGSWMD